MKQQPAINTRVREGEAVVENHRGRDIKCRYPVPGGDAEFWLPADTRVVVPAKTAHRLVAKYGGLVIVEGVSSAPRPARIVLIPRSEESA